MNKPMVKLQQLGEALAGYLAPGKIAHQFKYLLHGRQLALAVLLGSLGLTLLSWQIAARQTEATQQMRFASTVEQNDQQLTHLITTNANRIRNLSDVVANIGSPQALDRFLADNALRDQYPGMIAVAYIPLASSVNAGPAAPGLAPRIYPATPANQAWLRNFVDFQGRGLHLPDPRTGLQLIDDLAVPGLPHLDSAYAISVAVPPHGNAAPPLVPIRGRLLGIFDLKATLRAAFGSRFDNLMNIAIQKAGTQPPRQLFSNHPAAAGENWQPRFARYFGSVRIDGLRWQTEYGYRPTLLPRGDTRIPDIVLLSGLAMSLLATAVALQSSVRQREARLQLAREQQFRSLYSNNPDAVFSHDLNGRIVQANSSATGLLGVMAEALLGKTLDPFLAPEYRSMTHSYFQQAANGYRQHFDVSIINQHGERRIVYATFLPIIINRRMRGVFSILKDVTVQKTQEEQLTRLARYDQLTGLVNRSVLLDRLEHGIARSRTEHELLALLLLDLDHFKDINETLGHLQGDLVLTTVAQRLRDCARPADTVSRLAGDQFAVLREGLETREQADILARELLNALAQPYHINGRDIPLSACIGIAISPLDAVEAEDLLKAADIATDQAKSRGRNSYQPYERSMSDRLGERVTVRRQLRQAIDNNDLNLVFQPQLDLYTGEISGAESLLRWQHPERGILSPAYFIPMAEEAGMICQLGDWVLHAACAQIQDWQRQAIQPPLIAVNVSAPQFRSVDFPKHVRRLLEGSNVQPEQLEFEITEGLLMQDVQLSIQVLAALKDLGIRIAIDDFGTGYSSLSYLANFPLDVLKIDRSFIIKVPGNPQDTIITETIISLAHALNLRVVAEGVETWEQFEFLKTRGVDCIQGYYFSKPLPATEMTEMLKRRYFSSYVQQPGQTILH